ncbi:MAG: FG-GAP repeat protein [Planctomycetes bacterium]|nr:FG-GAP repeat protein [Planctomycetota bacterium]
MISLLRSSLERSGLAFLLLAMVPAGAAASSDPVWTKLLANDGCAHDHFGIGVAIQGSTLAVGAHWDDDAGIDSGSVYIFSRDSACHWAQTQKLIPATAGAGDLVGRVVLLDGERLFVSAQYDDDKGSDAGALYVFERSSFAWQEVAKLKATDGAAGHIFADSIAVDADRMVVSAPHDDDLGTWSGSAYVFERDLATGQWNEVAKLHAADGSPFDEFGVSTAVLGDSLFVSSHLQDDAATDAGAVYVFRRTLAGAWVQHQKITASDSSGGDWFGYSIALDGGVLVVGALKDDDNAPAAGSAYVFRHDAGTESWVQEAKLTASDACANAWFGVDVLVRGDLCIVGAEGSEDVPGTGPGAVYLFERDAVSGQWSETFRLTPADGAVGDLFGRRATLDGDLLVVPSVRDDDLGTDSGSTYVIDLHPSFVTYGVGCPGSGGITPDLFLEGCAVPAGTVTVSVANGVGGGWVFLFVGSQQAAVPIGFDCLLAVWPVLAGPLGPLPLFPIGGSGPGNGSLSFQALIPPDAPIVDLTIQAFVHDLGVSAGFSATNGVELRME